MTALFAPLSMPDGLGMTDGLVGILLRYTHILAGIVWIGMLYFFNLVNVNFQKEMTANLDPKGNHTQFTKLMPAALWWFRWGAMVTWLTGFLYYLMYAGNTGATGEGWPWWKVIVTWFVLVVVAWYACRFAIETFADKKSTPEAKAADQGMMVGIAEAVIGAALFAAFYFTFGNHVDGHVFFIACGGGLGTIMFMNVWMIIWPKSRQIIAWREQFLKDGTAVPPEAGKLGRRSFLASRTNTWFSVFLLLFMVLAGHGSLFWTFNK